ncbi:MAG TPA: carbamoyl-phosphate synthase large subunit [Thermosulfidibacter takaii]|uniref:Carbamoyl phosphate synthase large chain n=1 Tax=Thermosulfidibacter takaii TaxID=412593 RepID=A0A7C0YDT7_9BACT|nr:carbamoyl-phosphate synthase large subunit [Thermosulfidibacter takaii]
MPKRTDIEKILIIGSGPIIIGQACEFDYSGTQACKVLKEEGFTVVLVNSNPATIMTDPEMAHRTYVEPITPEIVAKIIEKERPQALLPTLGGQTALNVAVALAEGGVLDKFNVELIGAKLPAIKKAEDRDLFKQAMENIGLEVPRSGYVHSMEEAKKIIKDLGFPVIIRPSFTLGGTGGSVAYNMKEFEEKVEWGLNASPTHEVLIEESVLGWKEFELEVMRDLKDNVVIVCSIENFDPMGIHTGDSITVAPAQTLTDKEYQIMRDAAIAIIREIGVETGGSNIQFAVNPEDGRMVVIEMNPRVSRSSALASKATGFPIAKIAAKLAVGYTLDEIPNDITKKTPACFEPAIDYCVVKVPRFTFEKFPEADATLTTQMKSVGEVMAIGRTFKESLQKAIRSLEIDRYGLQIEKDSRKPDGTWDLEVIRRSLKTPCWNRLWYIADAFRAGMSVDEVYELTFIDQWFLDNVKEVVEAENHLKGLSWDELDPETLEEAKKMGFSDMRLAQIFGVKEEKVLQRREELGIKPVFKSVDTCAAEFEAYTPYFYSTYERTTEQKRGEQKRVIILGGGPNRIGQGIEFDYCCVHGVFAIKEMGYQAIMVNCNPETVSTDYDTSDRLYFEPLTLEDVLAIIEAEDPLGVIIQFGGQTPLKLAIPLEQAGVPILGTSPNSIDIAEDRERFRRILERLQLRQPPNATATSVEEAVAIAKKIGYPVLVRPSYVLGGRAMEIVYSEEDLRHYMTYAVEASYEHPVLVDKFLQDAVEIDVDALCDGEEVFVAGIMEHIEQAGVHSGDSACSLPPHELDQELIQEIKHQTTALALELKVVGLINIQYAIQDRNIYVLEVNPRASRTVPFVSKAIGIPLAKVATQLMLGKTLKDFGLPREMNTHHIAVKEAVFPFIKFPGVDTVLGPEMKSTGEVMGIDREFGIAFAKAQEAAGNTLPLKGNVFISVKDEDKAKVVPIARKLEELGFNILATKGTAQYLAKHGVKAKRVYKIGKEGVPEGRPHVVDRMISGEIQMVINTPLGGPAQKDSLHIRRTALVYGIPYFTTMRGAMAAAEGIEALKKGRLDVAPLQEYHVGVTGKV